MVGLWLDKISSWYGQANLTNEWTTNRFFFFFRKKNGYANKTKTKTNKKTIFLLEKNPKLINFNDRLILIEEEKKGEKTKTKKMILFHLNYISFNTLLLELSKCTIDLQSYNSHLF